ncbi:hypothetical protein [Nocardia sp. BMG51109]|uniref:hypothetical protein n=1 Tax=Nocardia sp. BMG51109 TaxID=1056816 RepID=UPI000464D557|nr:hypothetical protein [Nocardia sp. BMG51109]
MGDDNFGISLSAVHVRWSASDSAFEAISDQFPGLAYTDGGSAIAAIDGLMDLIRRAHGPGNRARDAEPAGKRGPGASAPPPKPRPHHDRRKRPAADHQIRNRLSQLD